MGTSHYVYLGPYLECEYVVVNTVEHHWACPNTRCPLYGQREHDEKISFCGMCGRAFGKASHAVETSSVDCWTLSEEINEALWILPLEYIELDMPVHVWIPNHRRGEPRKFSINPVTDYRVMPIPQVTLVAEQAWLIEAFHDEIELLREHYKRCDVRWGLIVYGH